MTLVKADLEGIVAAPAEESTDEPKQKNKKKKSTKKKANIVTTQLAEEEASAKDSDFIEKQKKKKKAEVAPVFFPSEAESGAEVDHPESSKVKKASKKQKKKHHSKIEKDSDQSEKPKKKKIATVVPYSSPAVAVQEVSAVSPREKLIVDPASLEIEEGPKEQKKRAKPRSKGTFDDMPDLEAPTVVLAADSRADQDIGMPPIGHELECDPDESSNNEKPVGRKQPRILCGKYIYGYHAKFKARWRPRRAFMEQVCNKLLLVLAIVTIIYPTNQILNGLTGFLAMFEQINMHFWYGFPNYDHYATKRAAAKDPFMREKLEKERADFEKVRDHFSRMKHHDDVRRSQIGAHCVAFVAVLPMKILAYLSYSCDKKCGRFALMSCFECILDTIYKFILCGKKDKKDRPWTSAGYKISVFYAALYASLLWSLIEAFTTTAMPKIVVSMILRIQEEYYNALLHRNSFMEFMWDLFTGIFGDFMKNEDFTEAMELEFDFEGLGEHTNVIGSSDVASPAPTSVPMDRV